MHDSDVKLCLSETQERILSKEVGTSKKVPIGRGSWGQGPLKFLHSHLEIVRKSRF